MKFGVKFHESVSFLVVSLHLKYQNNFLSNFNKCNFNTNFDISQKVLRFFYQQMHLPSNI